MLGTRTEIKSGFMEVRLLLSHRAYTQKGSILLLMLHCHHLELPSNFLTSAPLNDSARPVAILHMVGEEAIFV